MLPIRNLKLRTKSRQTIARERIKSARSPQRTVIRNIRFFHTIQCQRMTDTTNIKRRIVSHQYRTCLQITKDSHPYFREFGRKSRVARTYSMNRYIPRTIIVTLRTNQPRTCFHNFSATNHTNAGFANRRLLPGSCFEINSNEIYAFHISTKYYARFIPFLLFLNMHRKNHLYTITKVGNSCDNFRFSLPLKLKNPFNIRQDI